MQYFVYIKIRWTPVKENLINLGTPPPFLHENYKWRNYEISEIEHYCRELLLSSGVWKKDVITDYRTAYREVNIMSMSALLDDIEDMLSSPWKFYTCSGNCGISFDRSTSTIVLRTEETGFRICSSGIVAALAIDAIKSDESYSWSVDKENGGGAHRELHLQIPAKIVSAIKSSQKGEDSILATVCVAEYVRHLNDYSHWGIDAYSGDRFALTINKDLEHFNKFAHTICSSR